MSTGWAELATATGAQLVEHGVVVAERRSADGVEAIAPRGEVGLDDDIDDEEEEEGNVHKEMDEEDDRGVDVGGDDGDDVEDAGSGSGGGGGGLSGSGRHPVGDERSLAMVDVNEEVMDEGEAAVCDVDEVEVVEKESLADEMEASSEETSALDVSVVRFNAVG